MRHTGGLIVGGGPAGLAVAYSLQGDTIVLEKEAQVGGLCRSVTHGEGVFDIGGHSFHTPHPEVFQLVQELLPGGLELQRRDARVFSHGTLIPYPFQKNYDKIPDPEVVRACDEGLKAAANSRTPPRNFEEYIVRTFGQGIADHFMLPYNRKLWARDIGSISCEWTSERVAAPKGKKEKFDTEGDKRKPLQADTRVGYPRTGGFEEIYRALAARAPAVETAQEVVHIDPVARAAATARGDRFRWRFLVSTVPLPILVRIIAGTPSDVVAMADALEYMSLRVEFLLTSRPIRSPIQRIYSADPEIPAHKMALNHNSSDSLRAREQHAIMAEVSISAEKPVDVHQIAPRTIRFLCDVGVLESPSDVVWTGHRDVKFAYPVYTHDRPELVSDLKKWLQRNDIYVVGRFGDWEYVNSDRCVKRGLELGRQLREEYGDTSSSLRGVSGAGR